jgi:hypothetical protein
MGNGKNVYDWLLRLRRSARVNLSDALNRQLFVKEPAASSSLVPEHHRQLALLSAVLSNPDTRTQLVDVSRPVRVDRRGRVVPLQIVGQYENKWAARPGEAREVGLSFPSYPAAMELPSGSDTLATRFAPS